MGCRFRPLSTVSYPYTYAATFLDYGEFSSFAPSIGSDGDPLVRSVKAPKRSKKSGIPTVDMAEARALAEDPHAEPAAVLEMNAALFKKLESLQEARLLKSAFAPSEDEIETCG